MGEIRDAVREKYPTHMINQKTKSHPSPTNSQGQVKAIIPDGSI
jgi:hypothetical protein